MAAHRGVVRGSLVFSIWDGIFASMTAGVSEYYLIPYAIALGATVSQVAFLSGLPLLVGSLIQIKSAALTQSIGSRTKLINHTVFWHALSWLPILAVPVLFPSQVWTAAVCWWFLGAAIVFVTLGALAVPAWQSLMADYIPVRKRGQYFGWRNRVQGIVTVAVSVAAGLLLNYYGKGHLGGFAILFIFAMFCRLASWVCLLQMREPFHKTSHDEYFSFMEFLKQIHTSHFTRFVFFVSLMYFSVNLSAPLLSVFLLRQLEFSYAQYMVVVTVAALSGFVFQSFWGRAADRYGNIRLIHFAGWGIAVLPLFWLVSRNLAYLIFVQIVAGAFWGGFTLLVTNFVLEAVPDQRRIRSIAYFNVTSSLFLFVGAVAGGWLYPHLKPLMGHPYLTLFVISGIGRAVAMELARRYIREVRCLKDFKLG